MTEARCWLEALIAACPGATGIRLRRAYWSRRLRQCGVGASFGRGFDVTAPHRVLIRERFACGHNCMLDAGGDGSIAIGGRVHLNAYVLLNASVGGVIWVGDDVLIGPHVTVRASDHRADGLHPVRGQGHTPGVIRIEHNVWIGAHAVILGGVTIGEGAVVGAGAVVTRDVAPRCRVGGVPAKALA